MNVVHLISGGEVGGSKKHLLTLVKSMKDRSVKNIIVCFIKGELYEEARKMGLDIRLVKQNKRVDLSVISRIRDICEKEKIGIVNCHGGRANSIGFFLKMRYKAKYVTTIHSDYREDYRGNLYKTLIFSNINRLILNSFDNYITVSDTFKEMLVKRRFNGNKIFVVYNGIDFTKPKINASREDIIKKYSLKETKHYVSMVARFHPVKGHKTFLEACRTVLEKTKDVTFILVGDGSIKAEMEEYAKELGIGNNTFFAGFQKPDEFMCISDFTVLSSFTESFPLTILESALYGKTVVATNVGGIPKLIDDNINGYLVEPGDSTELSIKILSLLEQPEKTVEMGHNLYKKAKGNYSIERLVDRYIEIYTKISSGGVRK